MNGLRVIICEDEVLIAEQLKSILVSFGFEVIGIAHTFKESIRLIDKTRPEMALLDIRMDGPSDGIEIGRYISENYNFPFLFISASADLPSIDKALQVNPGGYVVKPFEAVEIYSAIKIALRKFQGGQDESYIIIKEGYKEIKLYEKQIMYIKSDNVYVEITTASKKYTIRRSLDSILAELCEKTFIRCHRSYCINVNFIDQLHTGHVLIEGDSIPVSRKHQQELREVFKG